MFMRKTSVQIYELSALNYVIIPSNSQQPDLPRPIFLTHTKTSVKIYELFLLLQNQQFNIFQLLISMTYARDFPNSKKLELPIRNYLTLIHYIRDVHIVIALFTRGKNVHLFQATQLMRMKLWIMKRSTQSKLSMPKSPPDLRVRKLWITMGSKLSKLSELNTMRKVSPQQILICLVTWK